MSEKTPKYITTTLPYVNASPHIGFALELIQADVLARYYRLLGHEVFFTTGTDEHGQKIAQKADEAGIDRQAYVDKYAEEFKRLPAALNISNDKFIRTTDEIHKMATAEMWRRCTEAGDIYKKSYKGLYCVGCEAFKTEADLVDGKCPDHLKAPEEIEEENYFFRLSKYQSYLEEYLADETATVPNWRRLELLNFVQKGLEDLSISRQKSRMDWGIPVPDDAEHVMYVWFDALTNYISTLGWPADAEGNFAKFWEQGDTLQLAGKDQLRFQSVIWQAMLKSAGLPPTKKIFYHGFINVDGQKMSKSIGNVISPYELIERYGADATRYILLRHVHPVDDSDITWEKMDEWYTANLVNGLGNLVARVMKMAETHLGEPVNVLDVSVIDDKGVGLPKLLEFNFQMFLDEIWSGVKNVDWFMSHSIKQIDEKIQLTEPYKRIKSDSSNEKEEANDVIKNLVSQIWYLGISLQPVMPDTAKLILEAVKENKKPDNLFPRLDPK